MLEVLPIQTKAEQEALCARCGVPFKTEMLAYQALVDGDLRGICQFTMGPEGGRIVDFAPLGTPEFEPLFVMGRAALNFAASTTHFLTRNLKMRHSSKPSDLSETRKEDGKWISPISSKNPANIPKQANKGKNCKKCTSFRRYFCIPFFRKSTCKFLQNMVKYYCTENDNKPIRRKRIWSTLQSC